MEHTWITILKTTDLFEANVVKGKLDWAEVPCNILNQRDSSYGTFGFIEVRIPIEFLEEAKTILNFKSTDPNLN